MSISLYDSSVAHYVQILAAVDSFLEKGRAHFEGSGVSLDTIVDTRLIQDMSPFRFQCISVAHHSMGALKALESGEFAPPAGYGEPDFAGLQDLVKQASEFAQSMDQATINGYEGKALVFKLGANEMPFIAENFISSFSIPNFYFHATTAYDILRMKGVPLGKRDFIGALRMGA